MALEIDTLNIYERLKKAEFSDKAAKEIAEVFKETVEERLVTKVDLAEAKVEIIKWVAGMLIAQAGIIAALIKLL